MDDIPVAPLNDPSRKGSASPARIPAAHGPGGFQEPPRRSFFTYALAALIGGLASLVPLAAGVAMYLDPLRRKKGTASAVPVTSLDKLPDATSADAYIGLFKITADRQDAWNLYPNEPVGAVYLIVPKGTKTVKALNSICPHLGCFVDLRQSETEYSFKCPCHSSAFHSDGARGTPCVSPRDMDELKCNVVERDGRFDISVVFENFQPGLTEKKPKT